MVRTRLTIILVLLVLSQLVASGFLLWTVDASRYYIDRRRISFREVEASFTLGGSSFVHWQLLSNIAAGNQTDAAAALRTGATGLDTNLDAMLAVTQEEIDLIKGREGDIEIPEEKRIPLMEVPTRKVVAESRELADGIDAGWDDAQVKAKAAAMMPLLEKDLGKVMQSSLLEERDEQVNADAAAAKALSSLIIVALIVTALGIILGAVAIYFLARKVSQPMSRLLGGVREFTRGRLEHRTGLKGKDEFAQLGQALDRMASQLDQQHQELLRARNSLADTVAERTAELAKANKELRKIDELRREFLANVSHELRTPITVIRGEADVTLRGSEDLEEYRDTLRRVVAQAGQLTKLVDDLLLIARSGAGALKLECDAVDVIPLLEEARRQATSLTPRDVEITLSGERLLAEADPNRLTQLVMILLDNAIRYAGPQAKVRVEVHQKAGMVEISVSDNGPGIASEDLEHVFERFYRGRGDNSQAGSGLGLNIAKAIVDAHGGRIRIESAPDKGTTVIVALPLATGIKGSDEHIAC